MIYADDPGFGKAQIRPILGGRTERCVEMLFNNDDGIEVSVLPGTILPDDPVTKAEQAMELARMNRITNELLYESIGIPNPDEESDKLDLNQTVIEIKAQELQQRAAMQAQETATMQNEKENISQQIDELDVGWEQSAQTTPQWTAPVNISIWGQTQE